MSTKSLRASPTLEPGRVCAYLACMTIPTLPQRFVEVADAVRDTYVGEFAGLVGGFADATHVVEPVLLDAEGGPAVRGPLALPCRADFADLESGELAMFSPEKAVAFDPFSFPLGETEVLVAPFHWDNAVVRVSGAWDKRAALLFEDWFRRAFGDDDAAENIEMQNVVHFVSDPEISEEGYAFTADLGTAPASTLFDLLLALIGNSPARIAIGEEDQGLANERSEA